MFEGLSSKFNSIAEKAKSAFSFGNKSPESAKAILPPEVDVRPEIHNKVSDVMSDRAMDAWAKGEGWNTKEERNSGGLDDVMFEMPGKNSSNQDLSVFNRGLVKDETPDSFGDLVAEIQANMIGGSKISGRLNEVVLDMPKTDAQRFKVDTSAGNGWFGVNYWATANSAKFTEPVDSPSSVFAAFGEASRFDETPLTQEFLDAARDDVKARPVYDSSTEAANDDLDYAGTNVVPFRRPPTIEEVMQIHPPLRPGESFGREPRGAIAMRLAAIAASIMAVVGGAHVASHSGHDKPNRSYNVDDIVPMNNEQAKKSEAFRIAEKQRANQPIFVAQN